jgi:N-acetylmuramoyl-L-alanine amidase
MFSGCPILNSIDKIQYLLRVGLFIGIMTFCIPCAQSDKLVVLDPGHGGADSGTLGKTDSRGQIVTEKDLTLELAQLLKVVLIDQYGYRVRLTRNSDIQMALADRTAFANNKKADLFVSLHVNSSGVRTVRGFEAYYLDVSGDEAAMRLAEAENRANGLGADSSFVDDVQFILSDLVQSGKMPDSIKLAHQIEESVLSELVIDWPGVRSLGVKKAPFYVLMGARMPCVLLELFFADNLEDLKLLRDSKFKNSLVQAVGKGMNKFLGD